MEGHREIILFNSIFFLRRILFHLLALIYSFFQFFNADVPMHRREVLGLMYVCSGVISRGFRAGVQAG